MPDLVWVTRSSPFNLLTTQRLRAMGFGVITAPLLEVRALVPAGLPWTPDLIAFTSVHGVRHHPFQASLCAVPVLAVGNSTAAAARRIGFRDVRSAQGAVAQLQSLTLRSAGTSSRLVHFGALEPAGDLVGYLSARGFEAVHRAVYETRPATDARLKAILDQKAGVNAILIHSPKSAHLLATLVRHSAWQGTVFCTSDACAAAFKRIPGVTLRIAAEPTERSLLSILNEPVRRSDRSRWKWRQTEHLMVSRGHDCLSNANDKPDLSPSSA